MPARSTALLLASALLMATSCQKPAATVDISPPRSTPSAYDSPDNLLQLIRGVVVTERSGEMMLERSALNAVDGDPTLFWSSPPSSGPQTMRVALPALTRLTAIGGSNGTPAFRWRALRSFRLFTSLNDKTWTPAGVFVFRGQANHQLLEITPRTARYLRFETIDAFGGGDIDVSSFEARGSEIEPTKQAGFAGVWHFNGEKVFLRQEGRKVTGVVHIVPPMFLEGWSDGRTVRMVWSRRQQNGPALMAIDPSGTRISGFWWFEVAIPERLGAAWFGSRSVENAPKVPGQSVSQQLLGWSSSFPLNGVVFSTDGALEQSNSTASLEFLGEFIAANSQRRIRLAFRELRGENENSNLQATRRQVAAVRAVLAARRVPLANVSLEALGSGGMSDRFVTPIQRHLYSRIDLEVLAAK